MSPPSITLEITKGPREGDTLTYHPNTDPIVRIGRLIRGNTLAIKDVGISSRHLMLEFHPDSCSWILNDLDYSNGTFVNGSAVGMEPGKGYAVGDGDRVKIGESTDFVCRIWRGGGGATGLGLRRNPRRRGNLGEEKGGGVRVLEEIANGNGGCERRGVWEEKRPAVRRRGSRKDGEISKEVGMGCQREAKGKENSAVVGGADSREVGRLKTEMNLRESEMKGSEDCPVVTVEESKRRRGGRKDEVSKGIVVKREHLEELIVVEKVVQVVDNVAMEAHASAGRTRSKPKKEEQLLDKVLENDGLACGDNRFVSTKMQTGLQGRRKIARAAEELKKLDVIEELVDGVSKNEENNDISNSIQGGLVEREWDLPEGNKDSGNIDGGKKCVDPPGIQKGRTGCHDTTDVKNGIGSEAKADAMRKEQMPDLSKITVREWLDWLESNLPKQIIAKTEKLIEEMRSKARRVKVYRAEQMLKREV